MNFYQELGFLVFGSRLKRLGDSFLGDVNKIYRKNNIAFDASWFPVFYLLSQGIEISIRNISDTLSISHSAASQMIKSLKDKGLLKSVTSKKDARHRIITFTAKGEKLLEKIKPVWTALQQAMEDVSNEDKRSIDILNSLTVIEKNLKKEGVFRRVEKKLSLIK